MRDVPAKVSPMMGLTRARWCGMVQLVIEEKGLEKDTNIRSTAMGVVPFHMMPEVRTPQRSLSRFHDRLFMTGRSTLSSTVVLTKLHMMPQGDQRRPTCHPPLIPHTRIRDDTCTETEHNIIR
jgi:hypothetical protein